MLLFLRRTLIPLIFVFSVTCSLWAEEESIIRDGLHYRHVTTRDPLSIYILEIDPSLYKIIPVRALEDGLGRETVSSLATRHEAVAGINGGFFKIGDNFDGRAAGILKIGPDWIAGPFKPRGAIGWSQGGQRPLIARLLMEWSVKIGKMEFPINGINRPRGPSEAILYTWAWHRNSLTDPQGDELLIHKGKIIDVRPGKGSSSIPENGFVCSFGPHSPLERNSLKKGMPATVKATVIPVDASSASDKDKWQQMDYIVGGVPILIKAGVLIEDFSAEQTLRSFIFSRHPRTAVGIKQDGTWVFVVVDGRQPGSHGMTLQELGKFMQSVGCVEALNFDGGGSSAFFFDGRVVNSPVGDEDEQNGMNTERRVSDALLILKG